MFCLHSLSSVPRFPTLSTKFLAPKDWKFLPFNFIARDDLKAPELIAAAPEWNFWQFALTCALFISGSNTYLVRKRVKQHPAVSFAFVLIFVYVLTFRESSKAARV